MGFGRLIRLVVGILLIPVCVAAVVAFARMLAHAGESSRGFFTYEALAVLLGSVAYILAFVFFHETIVKNIFGREPVRRIWGSMTGYHGEGRRYDTEERIDSEGRRVPLYVVLLPYAVPLYTVFGVLVVWIINYLFGLGSYHVIQGFVVGLTYTFHLFLVAYDIQKKHADLRVGGYLFTLVVLLFVNLQILAAVLMVVLDDASWVQFNRELLGSLRGVYDWCWDMVSRPF